MADGGLREKVRAGGAAPLVSAATAILRVTAATGSAETLHRRERMFARWAERLARVEIDVGGVDRIDPAEQYVVVPLHEGFADVLGLFRFPLGLRFAARDELFEWPGLGRYLEAAGHVRVDTVPSSGSARRFLEGVARVFAEGDSLVVFAQGSILGLDVAFRPGAVRVARRFGRPVLPVVLTGSHRVWEHPYRPTLHFGQRISMRVLEPIPPQSISDASFREMERAMKRAALAEGVAPARRYRPEVDGWWDGYEFEIDPDFLDLRRLVDAHRAGLAGRDSD